MWIRTKILPVYNVLQVVMQLFTSLAQIFFSTKFEEGLAWQSGQLRMFTPEIWVECLELAIAFPQLPFSRSQMHLDFVEYDWLVLHDPLFEERQINLWVH